MRGEVTSTTSMQRERHSGELDLFGLYLNEVGRHPLLTKQDEIQLSQACRQGLDAKLALAELAAADPRRPALAARAERGEQPRRRMIRVQRF
jgi:Sigma-70 factor, region 1.2